MRDDAVGEAGRGTEVMTIGALSRRTGIAVKTLRTYEDAGLIFTAGRSPGNYRLFTDEAVTCVKVIEILRSLGLTLAELQEFAGGYLARPDEPARTPPGAPPGCRPRPRRRADRRAAAAPPGDRCLPGPLCRRTGRRG